jgi:hypothetical protein
MAMEIFDETLDINSTANYELSLQVSPESISFCLLDTLRNKFVMLRTIDIEESRQYNLEKIKEIFSDEVFLKKHYKKINVILPAPKLTVVPAPLYDPGKKDEFFLFNHAAADSDIIIANSISEPAAYILFSTSKQVVSLIASYYPGVHPMHHTKPLLSLIAHNRKRFHGNYIHLHAERDFFNLIIFDHNTMKFCNTFKYRNITDIMYHVLDVFRNMNIRQEETIHLSGNTSKYDDLSSNLAIYIRNVRFAEPSGGFSFSYVFNDTDLHRHINLFSSVTCG